MAAVTSVRRAPNILVSGTPGTGKTTLATSLAVRTNLLGALHTKLKVEPIYLQDKLSFQYINIGDMVSSIFLLMYMNEELYELVRRSVQIKTKGYHAGRDEEFDSFIFDEAAEDKVTI